MKWTHAPDEMYYHTLVANGPTSDRVADSLTGTIWIEGKRNPETITPSNLPALLKRHVFLARKFATDDFALLDTLEESLTTEHSPAPFSR